MPVIGVPYHAPPVLHAGTGEDIMAAVTPHTVLIEALTSQDWTLAESRPVVAGGGPNPSYLVVQRGRTALRLLTYAWRITGEGKGRVGTNYRVQATRSHDGDLLTEEGWVSLGLGWDEARQVLAAFDPWIKRTTGRSNSVHIRRSLLDGAQANGWATEERDDGPECAFQPSRVADYLQWTLDMQQPRFLKLAPDTFTVDGRRCSVRVFPRSGGVAFRLRPGDHFTLVDGPKAIHHGVWRVEQVDTERTQRDSGSQRVELIFTGALVGALTRATGT